jgi:hypothetical protein
MDAEVVHYDERGVLTEVTDNSGAEHRLALTWDGFVDVHEQDRFPIKEAERTEFQDTVLQQVSIRAVYEAHKQVPDADFLPSVKLVDPHERALEALENLSTERFRDLFADYYRAVIGDPRPSDSDIHRSQIEFVYLAVDLHPDEPRIEGVSDVYFDYIEADERQYSGPVHDVEGDILLQHHLVDEPVDFPGEFRSLLRRHLKCLVRDIYLNMGTEPPAAYDIEGMGKIAIHGRPAIDQAYTTG